MTIAALIVLVSNRLSALNQQRGHAVAVGDVERVAVLGEEIATTEQTLAQLRSLNG
jgi:hypothetical protein